MTGSEQSPARGPDLRLPLLGLAAWAGALVARWEPSTSDWTFALLLVVASVCWPSPRCAGPLDGGAALTGLAVVVVAAGVGAVAVSRATAVRDGPVADLARERALVTLTGTVTADPRRIPGRFGERVLVRVAVGRHQPVLVFGDDDWEQVAMQGAGAVHRPARSGRRRRRRRAP